MGFYVYGDLMFQCATLVMLLVALPMCRDPEKGATSAPVSLVAKLFRRDGRVPLAGR